MIAVRFVLRVLSVLILGGAVASSAAFGQLTVVNPLSANQTRTFYHLPEGGAVMPLAWYRSLEVIDSTTGRPTGQTFSQRMSNYGFLDDPNTDLPVGFGTVSLDFLGGLQGLSLNCAACHVGELHYQLGAVRLRVNGGPNLADVRRFSQDVYQSSLAVFGTPGRLLQFLVRSERLQPATLARLRELPINAEGEFDCVPNSVAAAEFAAAVDGLIRQSRASTASRTTIQPAASVSPSASSSAGLTDIGANLQLLLAELQYFTAQGRMPLSTPEGFGRLDAFGTVRFLLFPEESAGFQFTAPVSVPHLWGIGRKQWLHWNNNTNSTLQRNIDQSLGTGALQTPGGVNNVLLPNLASLETIAEQIASPVWPASVFGALDQNLVQRGAALFADRCTACHNAGTVDSKSGLVTYRMFSLAQTGTDPNDALNFHQPVGAESFAAALAERVQSLETWYFNRRDPSHPVPLATRIAWSGGPARLPAVWRDPLAADLNAPVYAALPLDGVWATAPYLHNNSVPTLRDLLKPAADRPAVFMVGQRDFDPVNVGYQQPANPATIPAIHRFDTQNPGNANTGHEGAAFGSENLSTDDIRALLEYLKSI